MTRTRLSLYYVAGYLWMGGIALLLAPQLAARITHWGFYVLVLLLAVVILHAAAALYHQFVRRDELLARMWFGKR